MKQFDEMVANVQRLQVAKREAGQEVAAIKMSFATWTALVEDLNASKLPAEYTRLIGIPVHHDNSIPFGEFREVLE